MSSGLHRQGAIAFDDLQWERRAWSGSQAYSDSKLQDAVLAAAVAARWPGVSSNAVEPGWVATKMGGPEAPDDLQQGSVTQAWLAAGEDPAARTTRRLLLSPPSPGAAPRGARSRSPARAAGRLRGANRGRDSLTRCHATAESGGDPGLRSAPGGLPQAPRRGCRVGASPPPTRCSRRATGRGRPPQSSGRSRARDSGGAAAPGSHDASSALSSVRFDAILPVAMSGSARK